MTLAAMKQEASRIKEVKEVQHFFINQTGSENWEEVEKRSVEITTNLSNILHHFNIKPLSTNLVVCARGVLAGDFWWHLF